MAAGDATVCEDEEPGHRTLRFGTRQRQPARRPRLTVAARREDSRAAGGLVARQQARSPRQRVRAGGGDEALRHPVVNVAEALEAPFLVFDDVEEGATVELHVGEVLEEDVDRLDVATLELLP